MPINRNMTKASIICQTPLKHNYVNFFVSSESDPKAKPLVTRFSQLLEHRNVVESSMMRTHTLQAILYD